MKSKNITIDELATMVQKGFGEVTNQMAKKSDMELGFKEVNKRLDKIENLVLANHKKRIEKLEVDVKDLKELFAIN